MEQETAKKGGIWRRGADGAEEVNAQDQLQSYLQVAGPGILIFVASILLLLAGFFCWAVFGRIETTLPITVVYQSAGEAEQPLVGAYLERAEFDRVEEGMKVRVAACDGVVLKKRDETAAYGDRELCQLVIALNEIPEQPEHQGVVVLADIRPISYLFN